MFYPVDTRIWEVKDNSGKSLGAFLYGDMVIQFNNSRTSIKGAYEWLTHIGYTYKEIGNIYPLAEISENKLIEDVRVVWRRKEAKADLKYRKKKGYTLQSKMRFGKHTGKTIQQIIEKETSYWGWLVKNKVLLLHPELDVFTKEINL